VTVFSDIHRAMRLPPDYHTTRWSPPLSPADRAIAIARLEAAGVIKGRTKDALMEAICERLGRLAQVPTSFVPRRSIRCKRTDIVEAIIADPDAKPDVFAAMFGRSVDTIRRYKKQLRDEGKIA
jgi:hypothetical protein